MKIYIVYQIQPCQFLILVLYSPVCACSVICKSQWRTSTTSSTPTWSSLRCCQLWRNCFQTWTACSRMTKQWFTGLSTFSRLSPGVYLTESLLEWPPTLPTCCPLRTSGPSSRWMSPSMVHSSPWSSSRQPSGRSGGKLTLTNHFFRGWWRAAVRGARPASGWRGTRSTRRTTQASNLTILIIVFNGKFIVETWWKLFKIYM